MKRIYFILILIFGCANSLFASESWELEKDEDGIKVYTRMTDKSDVKEFKAVTTINADKTPEFKNLNYHIGYTYFKLKEYKQAILFFKKLVNFAKNLLFTKKSLIF